MRRSGDRGRIDEPICRANARNRSLDTSAQALARSGTGSLAGFTPSLQWRITTRSTLGAKTSGVNQEPNCGEIDKHLVTKNRPEIDLDIRRTREARIVAHQANA